MADADGKNHLKESTMNGNVQAMREALETILRYVAPICRYAKPDGEQPTALFAIADTVRDIVAKALAAPPLNCNQNQGCGNDAAMTLDEAIAHAEAVAGVNNTPCGREHRQLADWLKELRSLKHSSVGNAAAMCEALQTNNKLREALEKVNEVYDILSKPCIVAEEARQACREARGILIPALSKPPRQCDVGTAAEQAERFKKFCFDHQAPWHGCTNCPVLMSEKCALAWAQTPYKAERKGDSAQ